MVLYIFALYDFYMEIQNTETQKEKIRNKYKGINPDNMEVIPAIEQVNFYEDRAEKRIAVYVRVSTDDIKQTSSYELQKNHYTDVVNKHEGWKLVDIYADEGLTGTMRECRDSFNRMIDDCKSGKIDLIITKSVPRFARNLLDSVGIVRELRKLNPPSVFFLKRKTSIR
jgi:hypothetical protein